MKKLKKFPFDHARRLTEKELEDYRVAIETKTGQLRKERGRPKKDISIKFEPISIRLHPIALAWAKKEAKKTGVGYQTIINQVLLKKAAA